MPDKNKIERILIDANENKINYTYFSLGYYNLFITLDENDEIISKLYERISKIDLSTNGFDFKVEIKIKNKKSNKLKSYKLDITYDEFFMGNLDLGWFIVESKFIVDIMLSLLKQRKCIKLILDLFSIMDIKVYDTYLNNLSKILKIEDLWQINLLLKIAEKEGRNGHAYTKLKRNYNRLDSINQKILENISLKEDIKAEAQQFKEQLEKTLTERDELKAQFTSLTEKYDQRIELIEKISRDTINQVNKRIKEQDLFITDERREGLLGKMDQLDKRITESSTNTRLFLVFISIIFTLIAGAYLGLTGWLISLLIKLVGV